MQEDINKQSKKEATINLGDFNCHLAEIGGRKERATDLRNLVETNNFRILNLDPFCQGRATWSRNNQETAIDFILTNHNIEDILA